MDNNKIEDMVVGIDFAAIDSDKTYIGIRGVPYELSYGKERSDLDGHDVYYVRIGRPKDLEKLGAAFPISGFGLTAEEAAKDFIHAVNDFLDFRDSGLPQNDEGHMDYQKPLPPEVKVVDPKTIVRYVPPGSVRVKCKHQRKLLEQRKASNWY